MIHILKSYSSQRLVKILNGEADTDVWKTIPQCLKNGEPITVWGYCTKPKRRYRIGCMGFFDDELYRTPKGEIKYGSSVELMAYDDYGQSNFLSGKVVAKFVVEKAKKLKWGRWVNQNEWNYRGWNYEHDELLSHTCLSNEQLNNYGDGKPIYALHITSLEIIEPMKLEEFKKTSSKLVKGDKNGKGLKRSDKLVYTHEPLTKGPQSWMYVLPPKEGEEK